RVRYQLAFSLGAIAGDMPNRALAELARRDGNDSWFRLAILSSVNGRAGDLFRLLIADNDLRASSHGRDILAALGALIGSANRKNEITDFVQGLNAIPEADNAVPRNLVRKFAAKLPASARGQVSGANGGKAGAILSDLLRDARTIAPDGKRRDRER